MNVELLNKRRSLKMKKITAKFVKFTYFLLAFFVMLSLDAQAAYIDPAATTYLIQAVAAVAIAIGAAFTIFRHKIAAFFKKGKKEEEKKEIHFEEDSEEGN